MKTDYIASGSTLPPFLAFPRFLLGVNVRFTAKEVYAIMLDMVGTLREAEKLNGKLPEKVFLNLIWSATVLDAEYGKTRDYMRDGGYTLVAETAEDVQEMKRYVDYESHVYEWAQYVGDDNSYISALYMMNNDFSIVLMIPAAVAPTSILREVEEEEE